MPDSEKSAVSTPHAPAAIGPYSQAVRLGGLVYTSGQIALDPATGQIVAGAIAEQTTRVLENLKAILAAAGSDFSRVVKTVVFLSDMNDFAAMNAVYAQYLAPAGVTPPARSTVEVARLPRDAQVEIEVIATVSDIADRASGAIRERIAQQVEENMLKKLRGETSPRAAKSAKKNRK